MRIRWTWIAASFVGLGACLASLAAPALVHAAVELDRREVHALERYLDHWQRCHAIELLIPRWRCRDLAEPVSPIAEVARTLRSLSGLEAVVAAQRQTGARTGDIAWCLLAASFEVNDELHERARLRRPRRDGGHAWRRRDPPGETERGPGWVSTLCDGVAVPDWLDAHATLGGRGLCAYGLDADRRVVGVELSRCLRTLATSRLASRGVGRRHRRPNIVVILADDQRWDTIDATHSPARMLRVPAMPATYTRLAREGLVFTDAVVTTPVCGPSRGSFFTGRFTHRHGMVANAGPRGAESFDDSDTWATRLDAAGYRTGFLGKYANGFTELWERGVEPPYVPPGWDDFRVFDHGQSVPQAGFSMVENGVAVSYDTAEAPYSTDVLAAHAIHFVETAVADPSGEPFALWISPSTPHYPWVQADRHIGGFDGLRLVRYPSTFEIDVSDKPPFIQLRGVPVSLLQLWGVINFRRNQLEMQLSTDEMVAALLDRLEALGVGDDTIIVYTSDNGHAWGEHRWYTKGCPWEECLKVPMLVRYPRLVPGARTEPGLVASIDILPTLLALAGADATDDVDGLDLSETIRGFAPSPERDVLFETYSGPNFIYAGVRRSGLKYFQYANGTEVLHDLEADPWELENYVDRPEYAAVRAELTARLHELWPGFDAVIGN